MTLGGQLLLEVAGGEVDSHGHGVVVPMGKARRDTASEAADAHDELRLVVTPLGEIRDEERTAVGQQRRVRLREDDGVLCFK